MLHLFAGLDLHTGLLLLLALAFVLFYEAINGFHDTANAVATVIYTRAMRSQLAVVMAAGFNFLGVLLGGLSVAYAIVHDGQARYRNGTRAGLDAREMAKRHCVQVHQAGRKDGGAPRG